MEKQLEVTSKKYSLNKMDFLRGLLIAMVTAPLMVIQTSIDASQLVFEWKKIGMTSVAAGIAYLIKNYLQPAQVKQTINSNEVDVIKDATNAKDAAK